MMRSRPAVIRQCNPSGNGSAASASRLARICAAWTDSVRVVGDQDQQEAGVAGDHVGVPERIGRRLRDAPGDLLRHPRGGFRGGGVPGRVRPGAQRHRDSSPPGEHPVVGHGGPALARPGQGQQPAAGAGRGVRRAEAGRLGFGAAEQHPRRAAVEVVGQHAVLEPPQAAVHRDRHRRDPVERTTGQVHVSQSCSARGSVPPAVRTR